MFYWGGGEEAQVTGVTLTRQTKRFETFEIPQMPRLEPEERRNVRKTLDNKHIHVSRRAVK